MYYPSANATVDAGDVIYVHPFAGEMPASRNVIASVSRDLARLGVGVLMIDLFGCGDSEGDFADARLEIWREDLGLATRWLHERGRDRLSLWGLRLGGLLACDFAFQSRESWERIVLWEPVLSGTSMITQFLRMNVDEAGDAQVVAQLVKPEARKALSGGDKIEVAGYEVSAELIHAIDCLDLRLPSRAQYALHWVEIGRRSAASLRSENMRVIKEWENSGCHVFPHFVMDSPFWLLPYSTDPARLTDLLPAMFLEAQA
jgi:exosortase A-associated hydrolase 2